MTSSILSDQELRKFGFILSSAVLIFGYIIIPFIFGLERTIWVLGISAGLAAWALVSPGSLKFIYSPWMKMAAVLGLINTSIILGVIFFFLITPIGWLLRMTGTVVQEKNTQEPSYKRVRVGRNKKHMENPY